MNRRRKEEKLQPDKTNDRSDQVNVHTTNERNACLNVDVRSDHSIVVNRFVSPGRQVLHPIALGGFLKSLRSVVTVLHQLEYDATREACRMRLNLFLARYLRKQSRTASPQVQARSPVTQSIRKHLAKLRLTSRSR